MTLSPATEANNFIQKDSKYLSLIIKNKINKHLSLIIKNKR